MARADITLTAVDQTRAAFDSVKRNLGDVERVAGSLSSTLAGLGAGLSAGALIGFAGPRVIEQTIRQSLPEGFQRSEFLLEHGFLDLVVPRPELKSTLARCLRHLA